MFRTVFVFLFGCFKFSRMIYYSASNGRKFMVKINDEVKLLVEII